MGYLSLGHVIYTFLPQSRCAYLHSLKNRQFFSQLMNHAEVFGNPSVSVEYQFKVDDDLGVAIDGSHQI